MPSEPSSSPSPEPGEAPPEPSAPAPEPASGEPAARKVQVSCSPGFLDWLAAEGIGVAFTTYQTNRLFLVGRDDSGGLAAFERLLDRPMGLSVTPERAATSPGPRSCG